MRRRSPLLGVAALVAVAALALAACTGPGSPGAPEGSATSERPPTPTETGTPSPTPTEPATLTWGPTREDLDAARAAVAQLSSEQLAGQVTVTRYAGTDPAAAASLVARHHLAGVIVMGDNVGDPDQLRGTAAAVQQAVADDGRDWPGIVSVDQEGGRVARVGVPATEFPTFMTYGAGGDAAVTEAATRASALELRAMGFTMVFAPDADVTSGPDDPTIGSRAAGDDPALVSRTVEAALAGYAAGGVVAVAKHFPGHGSVPADSHQELPVQDADEATLLSRDLAPFAAAAAAGVPAVMVGHLDVRAWDPGTPSSLSAKAYEALRRSTGFTGVAVTDALDMAGVTDVAGAGQAAVRALAAGADLLLMPADTAAATGAVAAALDDGTLPRARVEEAAGRVVALQLAHARQPAVDPGEVGAHGEESYAASLAGLTVLGDACSGRLVGDSVQVVGGTDADRARFAAAAEAAGLGVGGGDVVRLLGGATSSGSGDVVVALDAPYGLADSSASTARIALYGRTPAAFRALVDVLTGAASGGGALPVEVAGLPRGSGCA